MSVGTDEDPVQWAARRLLEDYEDQRVGNAEPWDASLEWVLRRTPKPVAEIVRAAVYGGDRERILDGERD